MHLVSAVFLWLLWNLRPLHPVHSGFSTVCIRRGGVRGLPRKGWECKGKCDQFISRPRPSQPGAVVSSIVKLPLRPRREALQRRCSSCGLLITATLPVIFSCLEPKTKMASRVEKTLGPFPKVNLCLSGLITPKRDRYLGHPFYFIFLVICFHNPNFNCTNY